MNNIIKTFSNVSDGNLGLYIGDNKDTVINNRKILASKLNKNLEDFVYMNQVHGGDVEIITKNFSLCQREYPKGEGLEKMDKIYNCDALVTKEKGIVLSVLVADCVPVLFFDEINEVIGVSHAGWKGTNKKIVQNTINKMLEIGANIENIKIVIGPTISECSYEVGEEVGINFRSEVKTKLVNGKQYLDLKKENKLQALELGIKEDNIEIINIDTFTDNNYFSARRDGFNKGRFGGFIYIK